MAIKQCISKATRVRTKKLIASCEEYYGRKAWASVATTLLTTKTRVVKLDSIIAENEGRHSFYQQFKEEEDVKVRCAEEVFKLFPEQPKE